MSLSKDIKELLENPELKYIDIDDFQGVESVGRSLKEFGFEFSEEDERNWEPTNGWAIDFWYYATNKETGRELELSGSVYHGGFKLTLTK